MPGLSWIVLVFGLISLTRLGWYFEGVGCHPTAASVTVLSLAFAAPVFAFETLRRRWFGRLVLTLSVGALLIEALLWSPWPAALTRSACP